MKRFVSFFMVMVLTICSCGIINTFAASNNSTQANAVELSEADLKEIARILNENRSSEEKKGFFSTVYGGVKSFMNSKYVVNVVLAAAVWFASIAAVAKLSTLDSSITSKLTEINDKLSKMKIFQTLKYKLAIEPIVSNDYLVALLRDAVRLV